MRILKRYLASVLFLHRLSLALLVVHQYQAVDYLHLKRIQFPYVAERHVPVLLKHKDRLVQRYEQRFARPGLSRRYSVGAVEDVKKSSTLTALNFLVLPQFGHLTS